MHQSELVVHDAPESSSSSISSTAQQVDQVRCSHCRRRHDRHQRRSGVHARRAQRGDDREEHHRWKLHGRSAGFLTPDSELELHQLVRRYGIDAAKDIWDMPCRGIDRLVENIKKFDIECGLLKQDSLFLGLGKSGKEAVDDEMACRQSVGFTDQKVYDANGLKSILGAENFSAGIRYTNTYGINPLLCVQGFKDLFIQHGLQVFESTAMTRLEGHTVHTHGGSVTADQIIIAADKPERSISNLADEIFHAQTFLSITEPLNDRELAELFPGGDQMQCWDSEAGVHILSANEGQSSAPWRWNSGDDLSEGRLQQSGHHQTSDQGLQKPLPVPAGSYLHSVLARLDRYVPGPAANRREAAEAASRPIHHGRRGPAVGCLCRRLRRQMRPRHCGG